MMCGKSLSRRMVSLLCKILSNFRTGIFFPRKIILFGVFQFLFERTKPGNIAKNKIYRRSIRRIDNGVCAHGATGGARNVLDAHILSRRQINPKIGVQRCFHDALHDCGGHANQHEADVFRFKGFQ